jgi:lipopolysaccharide transport system ATP-binding protein
LCRHSKEHLRLSVSDIAIRVDSISKCYRLGLKEDKRDSLARVLFDFVRSPLANYRKYRSLYDFSDARPENVADDDNCSDGIVWALRNVSFEVRKGQVLGIIGRNGAGKSTLLKVLSRITEPTSGRAEIHGKISSILEVGTGFHPELTGRENVYLNGAVLGMKKKEIDDRYDEIVDFSGVERFIHTPVKRYSSGMKVRLAFAVAAHLQPEILIIDEVLAVGDAEFQTKCLGKMNNITREGRTVLFVSHNMGALLQLCPTAIMLSRGKIVHSGESKEVVDHYLSSIFSPVNSLDLRNVIKREGSGRLRFVALQLRRENGDFTETPISGQPLDIVLDFETNESLSGVEFVLTIFNQMGIAVTNCSVETSGQNFSISKGMGRIVCHLPKLPLPLGQYKISIAAEDHIALLDEIPTACIFNVLTSTFFDTSFTPPMRYSTALVEHYWQIA